MTQLFAEVELEVPFHDIDVMDVVWHGHYVKYFEIGRCALLRRLDYDYPQMRESGYAWPVVDCQLRYVRSARFGQRLVVRATLQEYENRLRIAYEVQDQASGERLTKGQTIQVAVDMRSGELQLVSPTVLLERVQALLQGAP
ncbi:acyl-CoA thioesterase [Curvibacter sp. CHRR-16]|uniref:acyl-CoA thioesterase n=1 Tax=Curvibacter sp. CHRR-16 TaxID=2835872 RepID=UPI001BD9E97B|nr:thioesterase family protein [Curvibacter sp. CHRR-16]MBT0568751.1 acyl-CoA thioesterase [Curvibacter sp. CHRR-16]